MDSVPRPRSSVRWFVVGATLLAAVCCLTGVVVIWVDAVELHSHAVHAVATVDATGQDGRQKSYLIDFPTPDGTPDSLWTTSLPDGTQVGDRVRITYDAQRADNLRAGDGVDFGPVVLASVFLISVAMVFLWASRSALKAEPTEVGSRLLGRMSPAIDSFAFRPSGRGPGRSKKERRRERSRRAKRSRRV